MYQAMFQSTPIPVLEEVVRFTEARHNLLAGNIANLDTPGYRARDLSLSEFQSQLKEAIAARSKEQGVEGRTAAAALPGILGGPPLGAAATPAEAYQSPGATVGEASSAGKPLGEIATNTDAFLRHDLGDVGMEQQVTEMAKNQMQHNLALQIMIQQYRLLQTAISGKL